MSGAIKRHSVKGRNVPTRWSSQISRKLELVTRVIHETQQVLESLRGADGVEAADQWKAAVVINIQHHVVGNPVSILCMIESAYSNIIAPIDAYGVNVIMRIGDAAIIMPHETANIVSGTGY